MVVRIILLDKLYNISNEAEKRDLLSRYKKYLEGFIQGFSETDFKIRKIRDIDRRVELLINGPEETFVQNILKAEVGSVRRFDELKVGDTLKGTMVQVGEVGFGLFLDCGIIEPHSDVLLPLFTLREQFADGTKKSLNEIIHAFDFIEHFPLMVQITKIAPEERNIEAKVAPETLDIYTKIMNEGIEGLMLCGETKGQFKKALIREGHLQDIISLKRYGFLQHLALLTSNTNAPGVIAEIGKYLPKCKFAVINPHRIRKLQKE
jgi:hypothetical protein